MPFDRQIPSELTVLLALKLCDVALALLGNGPWTQTPAMQQYAMTELETELTGLRQ